jgi:hypothetical protein
MFNFNKGINNFINYISRKVAKIKYINKLILNVSISGYLIYSLLKKYNFYKPFLNFIKS